MPKVTVIIPAYNSERTVGRSIESALSQRFGDFEVIVVNDGSSDRTAEVLKNYSGRIKVVNQENRGLSGARNAGAMSAEGQYIAWLDADDEWLPDRLSKPAAPLERNPQVVLAYSDATAIEPNTGVARGPWFTAGRAWAPSMQELLNQYWPILPSAVLIRHSTFDQCGGLCEKYRSASGWEDVDFYLRAREQGEFVYVPESLVLYRSSPLRDRAEKYLPNFRLFSRRVLRRYGAAGRPLIASIRRSQTARLSYEGLLAMRQGRRSAARRCFVLALRYHPLHAKSIMRLARTFLPAAIAQALTGRTRLAGSNQDA